MLQIIRDARLLDANPRCGICCLSTFRILWRWCCADMCTLTHHQPAAWDSMMGFRTACLNCELFTFAR